MLGHLSRGLVGTLGVVLVLSALLAPAGADDRLLWDENLLRDAGIGTSAEGLLDYFRFRTRLDAHLKQVPDLIRMLGDRQFLVRETATQRLLALGKAAAPALQEALKHRDPEIVQRAGQCLMLIGARDETALDVAALRLLIQQKPAEALAVLLAYLPTAGDETLEEETVAALVALGVPDGQPDPALREAAASRLSLHRLAAAEALARSKVPEDRTAARRLLDDAEPRVRWHAARALLLVHDKSAVPALVSLLADGTPEIARQADDLLCWMAGDLAPKAGLGQGDPASRKNCRDAWAAWWRANEGKVDLARLNFKLESDPELAKLVEQAVRHIREALTVVPPDARMLQKARGLAVMIAAYNQSGPRGASTPLRATIRDAALRLAATLKDQRFDEAKKQAGDLLSLNPDHRAALGKVALLPKHLEFEEVMYLFGLTKRGGLGIESKMLKLGMSKTKTVPVAELNDELWLMAAHTTRVAETIKEFDGHLYLGDPRLKNKGKEWQDKAEELRLSAAALARAVKAKDPQAAWAALSRLNNACYQCHEVFRN